MLTKYTIWYFRQLDDIHIDECAVSFHQGAMDNVNHVFIPSVKINNHTSLKNQPIKKDFNGNDWVIFTDKDFGKITTKDELRTFLKGKVLAVPGATTIPTQS